MNEINILMFYTIKITIFSIENNISIFVDHSTLSFIELHNRKRIKKESRILTIAAPQSLPNFKEGMFYQTHNEEIQTNAFITIMVIF